VSDSCTACVMQTTSACLPVYIEERGRAHSCASMCGARATCCRCCCLYELSSPVPARDTGLHNIKHAILNADL
jgi:hypothetical protein